VANATDSSADESLEVERTVDDGHDESLCSRRKESRLEEARNNDEKAMTAVARAIRPITLQT
jgi:hypothetical protein